MLSILSRTENDGNFQDGNLTSYHFCPIVVYDCSSSGLHPLSAEIQQRVGKEAQGTSETPACTQDIVEHHPSSSRNQPGLMFPTKQNQVQGPHLPNPLCCKPTIAKKLLSKMLSIANTSITAGWWSFEARK